MANTGIGSQGHIDFLLSDICLKDGSLKEHFISEAEVALAEVAPDTTGANRLRELLEVAKTNNLQS